MEEIFTVAQPISNTEMECEIITGLIISDEYCKEIMPLLNQDRELIKADVVQPLITWINNYYTKYNSKAPFKNIQEIFKREAKNIDPGTADFIEFFLDNLSHEYEENIDKWKEPSYLIDGAKDYLQKIHFKNHAEKLAKFAHNFKYVQELHDEFRPLQFDRVTASILENIAITSTELMQKEFEHPETIISPWLFDGSITEIYAERGIGKTWLALSIAIAVTRKNCHRLKIGPWSVTASTGTLYLDAEMGSFAMQDRIRKLTSELMLEDPDYPLHVSSYNEFPQNCPLELTNEKTCDEIYKFLQDHRNIRLVILDNLSALTPGLDENSSQAWGPIQQWLKKVKALDCAIIFLHHAGKGGSQRGTSAREDMLDCVIKLKNSPDKQENSCDIIVNFEKSRNIGDDADLTPFRFTIGASVETESGLIWKCGSEINYTKANHALALILLGYSEDKIFEIVGMDRTYIKYLPAKAIDMGLLDSNGRLTPSGKSFRDSVLISDRARK